MWWNRVKSSKHVTSGLFFLMTQNNQGRLYISKTWLCVCVCMLACLLICGHILNELVHFITSQKLNILVHLSSLQWQSYLAGWQLRTPCRQSSRHFHFQSSKSYSVFCVLLTPEPAHRSCWLSFLLHTSMYVNIEFMIVWIPNNWTLGPRIEQLC